MCCVGRVEELTGKESYAGLGSGKSMCGALRQQCIDMRGVCLLVAEPHICLCGGRQRYRAEYAGYKTG